MEIAQEVPSSFRSTAVRPGPFGLIAQAVREVLSRRRLIRYLVKADVKKKGSDTLLGNTWWVLDPLLQMGVYVVLISLIFRRSTPDFPLFLFAAILSWKWFSSSTGDAVKSVVSQERLIKQIQFPKIVLPVAAVAAGVLNFAFGLIPLFLLLVVFYPAHFTLHVLWVPVIAAVQFVFTLAFALGVASINVFYRDIGNLSGHVLRLWFYLSPALWSFELLESGGRLDPAIRTLLQLNPFAVILQAYRRVIYGEVTYTEDGRTTGFLPGMAPDLVALGGLLLLSIGFLALTTWLFKRLEPAFAKVL